ncbi:phosphatidate cytidylyltransferase [Kozakia baliensis]|uniref:phosphatidate cytidylyltransferase n=1 Tax=Kozakia baliensis TaxID=153496 RepID=UPI00087AB4EF|nr:phosphatidate cytidylyltransferase [Kozakia baliensis]AOX19279.1 phosphatidate cytidylyltransferase [Kozakia baliensis]
MSQSRQKNWHDLRLRLISAAIIVPVALLCIIVGGPIFDIMILLVTIGMVHEGATMLGQRWQVTRTNWRAALLLVWPAVAIVAALRGEWRAALGVAFVGFIFGPALWAVLAVAIIGGLSLLWLRHVPQFGLASVLFVICVVIASDSFAYLSGRIFGGPKLAPSISPGKTRSGALGGLLGAGLTGAVVAYAVSPPTALGGFVWGALLGISAQCGDLTESAVKRRLGLKDSGRLIPGHGGLLDRFDGLLAAAPLAAILSLAVIGRPFWSDGPADLVHALVSVPVAILPANFG